MRNVGTVDARGNGRVQTINKDPSETVQSDAHLADVQQIMNSYLQQGRGLLDETALQFADVSTFTDLADAMNQAKRAEEVFMTLPSKVREIFDHDVAVWLDTSHDEEKRDALVTAGFLEAPEDPEAGSGEGAAAAEAAAAEGRAEPTGGPAASGEAE